MFFLGDTNANRQNNRCWCSKNHRASSFAQPFRSGCGMQWISIWPMFTEGTINFTNMFCKIWLHSLQTTIWENLLLFHWGHCHSTHSKILKDYTTDIQPRVHTSQTVYDTFNCNWVDTWWQQSSTHLHTKVHSTTQWDRIHRTDARAKSEPQNDHVYRVKQNS
jgi:hypothetical protein